MRYSLFFETLLFQNSLVLCCTPVMNSDENFYKEGFQCDALFLLNSTNNCQFENQFKQGVYVISVRIRTLWP